MKTHTVGLTRYLQPWESVRDVVAHAGGINNMPTGSRVFIKPNIVFWSRGPAFPKWGVITTSRVVQDVVRLLKEHGIDKITIGEGSVVYDPKDTATAAHAFETLGYNLLEKRYGVKSINVFERPFRKVDMGDGIQLSFNEDILESDFVVNLPVLKTHAQTVVSLGIKNIKGTLDIPSRKKCHSAEPGRDLHHMVSRLADCLPPTLTILDGIYTNERGPSFDGKIRRTNLLAASWDVFSVDKVGAKILGYDPTEVPHLALAAARAGRPLDLSDVEIVGETLDETVMHLEYSFAYNQSNTLPVPMEKMGITGLSYPKYDLTLCTYCSVLTGIILTSIAFAWQGKPWDDVEVLTGKVMKPTPGRKKTILIGNCLYKANKDHPGIKDMIVVKTCPPSPTAVVAALHQAGIEVNPAIFDHLENAPAFFMGKYEGKSDFDESFFRVD